MEPYAYFPHDSKKEPVTLFEYINKKIQGEKIPTYITVADLNIDNIYFDAEFKELLNHYFNALRNFISSIEKYTLDEDNAFQINSFLRETKSLFPNQNYLKECHYLFEQNWKQNKLILMGNKQSAFFHLFKNTNELFFLVGMETNFSFEKFNKYINTVVRLDYTHLYEHNEHNREIQNIEFINKTINKYSRLKSITSSIAGFSNIEYVLQDEIMKNLINVLPSKKSRKKIRKLYLEIIFQRKELMTFMNRMYYRYGKAEKRNMQYCQQKNNVRKTENVSIPLPELK